DDVTKMRLAAALAALDAQRDQRLELTRAAARFDAEHTRISYTLESLYTQVVRMRSADSSSVDVAGAGLRRSLDMLSHEVNALADALERVNSGEAERRRKGSSGPAGENGAVPPGAPGKREKAWSGRSGGRRRSSATASSSRRAPASSATSPSARAAPSGTAPCFGATWRASGSAARP